MEHQEVCRGHSRGSPSGKNCPRDQDFWWRIQWLLHEENEEKGERLELKNLGVENNFMKLRIINGHVSRKKKCKTLHRVLCSCRKSCSVYMYSRWYFSLTRIFELEHIRVSENVKVLMESFNQCLCTLIVDLQACCLCLACNFHS